MFKRLFISLLILSALTSEGIVNLPANIYKLYFNTDNIFDLSGEKATPPRLVAEEDSIAVSAESFDNGTLILTHNCLEKFVSKDIYKQCDLFAPLFLEYKPIPYSGALLAERGKDIVLRESDSSPPDQNTLFIF